MKRTTDRDYALVDRPSTVGPDHPVTADFLTLRYRDFSRELAFPETADRTVWDVWRRQLQAKLARLIRLDAWGEIPTPSPQTLEEIQCDGYVRRKVAYETFPGNWVVAYLLVPEGVSFPAPAVICPHGHTKEGKVAVVDPSITEYGAAYGHELARRGMVVLAPDNAGMGERDITVPEGEQRHRGCELLFRRLQHMGLDVTGLRVFDLIAGLNMLSTMEEVDESRLGCAGLSGGCWLSMFLAALDERVKAVILSGFMSTFTQTIWIGHCMCEHIYGIGEVCDLPDVCALIAPRPVFVESGTEDFSFPFEPAYSLVHRAYVLAGAEDRLGLDRYDGGHLFRGKLSIPWLVARLTAPY